MNTYPKVSIIVLNWCSADSAIACVESLERLDYPNYEIILVDNGSQDGSESALRSRFPNYDFIQTGKNLGYAAGNNHGIRRAIQNGAEYVWILNPDVTVEKNSLQTMIQVMQEDSSIGICGPRMIENSTQNPWCFDGADLYPHKGYRVSKATVNKASGGGLPKTKEAGYVVGCSMLIRSQLISSMGLMREDFFLYYEDVELSLRARDKGWKTVIACETTNRHESKWGEKTERDLYHFRKGAVLIARMQKKYIFETLQLLLWEKYRWEIPKKEVSRTNLGFIRDIFPPMMAGLFKPLKPIPRVCES